MDIKHDIIYIDLLSGQLVTIQFLFCIFIWIQYLVRTIRPKGQNIINKKAHTLTLTVKSSVTYDLLTFFLFPYKMTNFYLMWEKFLPYVVVKSIPPHLIFNNNWAPISLENFKSKKSLLIKIILYPFYNFFGIYLNSTHWASPS